MTRVRCIVNTTGSTLTVIVVVQAAVFNTGGDATRPSFRLDDWELDIYRTSRVFSALLRTSGHDARRIGHQREGVSWSTPCPPRYSGDRVRPRRLSSLSHSMPPVRRKALMSPPG